MKFKKYSTPTQIHRYFDYDIKTMRNIYSELKHVWGDLHDIEKLLSKNIQLIDEVEANRLINKLYIIRNELSSVREALLPMLYWYNQILLQLQSK